MIFMLCGTSDARCLAVQLSQAGYTVMASVVTADAASSLQQAGVAVQIGRLDAKQMQLRLTEQKAQLILDATHPFAEEAHHNAMQAARALHIPYIRYERPVLPIDSHPRLTVVSSYEEAALAAQQLKGSIMLTTGGKTLPLFARHLLGREGIRLVVRLLPCPKNMELCRSLGLKHSDIIGMQGPFNRELNKALYRHFGTTVMITKNSGASGSFSEKVGAALELGLQVIVIDRPVIAYDRVGSTPDEVKQLLEQVGMLPHGQKQQRGGSHGF